MIRAALLLCTLLSFHPLASAASIFTDLYGARCQTIDSSSIGGSRLCRGVAGFALMVYDSDDRASVDIVSPDNALYPLAYWDVVTAGYTSVGQKAEWVMERRHGKPRPTALLVRLTRLDTSRPGELIAAARIFADGACVVYRGDLADATAAAASRRAASDPASRCLAPLDGD